MNARDFFVAMPELCGARNAARWADIIGYVYDKELAGDSVYARNLTDEANPDNRLEVAFGWQGDEGAKEQCRRLCRIILYKHYLDEHGEAKYQAKIDAEYKMAEAAEGMYPEIADELTAYEALAIRWAD